MRRRGFFKRIVEFAAVVAIAPRIAFRAPKIEAGALDMEAWAEQAVNFDVSKIGFWTEEAWCVKHYTPEYRTYLNFVISEAQKNHPQKNEQNIPGH